MTVALLIVNWNSGDLLNRCLKSVSRQRRLPDLVIVVDNGSVDDSLAKAWAFLQDVRLIRLPTNEGFARANNIACQVAGRFDAIALLNPDAFAEPEWLDTLLRAADRADPQVASFASQIRFDSDPDYLDGAGDSCHVSGRAWRNGHGTRTSDWPAHDGEVFAPCAAAALYRREAFEAVGGFDERYFAYFEDVDLGFRLRLRGYRSLYVHDAVVRHVSSALSGYRSDFSVYHGERNMVWTFVKDMPGTLFWRYLPQHILLNLASLLYYPLRGQGRVAWKAKWDALKSLPAVLRQRRVVQENRAAPNEDIRKSLRDGLLTPYLRRYW